MGGLRIANFVRRLPRFGWNPYVLTIKDHYLNVAEEEKLSDIDLTKIFKAGRTPTLLQAYMVCKRFIQRLFRKSDIPVAVAALNRGTSDPGKGSETLSRKLRRYILSFLVLPDGLRSWIWPAVFQAVRIVRREKIQCILTSCPPYSAHLVGLLVKWITGVRWVADFRDPWMTTGAKALYPTCTASLAIERWMERSVVRNADRVIANTEMLHEGLKKSHSSISPDRFICIPNGFDSEFFSHFTHFRREEVFTITYTGSLYFGRTPEPVFQAVRDLLQEGMIGPQRIRIRLVGQCEIVDGRPTSDLIKRYGLEDIVNILEPVPYKKAIELVKQSHLALLLAPNQPYQIPAKVYDYMGVGTRVLALANEGATANLVKDTGIGAAFDPSDIAGIKGFIGRSLGEREASTCSFKPDAVKQYDLNSISSRLADELSRICVVATATKAPSPASDFHHK